MKTVLSILILIMTGCASMSDSVARTFMIKETKDGGRIMLNGTGNWMESGSRKKAESDMNAKCPNGFEVVENGLMQSPEQSPLLEGRHLMEKYLDFKCTKKVAQK